jgi:hypothetical protein
MYMYYVSVYIVLFSVNIYTGNKTNEKQQLLFAANGKWERQISVCLLQKETENGRLFSLLSKR